MKTKKKNSNKLKKTKNKGGSILLSSLKYIKTGILSHFWLKKPRNRVTWEHVRRFESSSLRQSRGYNFLLYPRLFLGERIEDSRGGSNLLRRSEVSTDDLTALGLGCQPCAAPKRRILFPVPPPKGFRRHSLLCVFFKQYFFYLTTCNYNLIMR